MKNGKIRFRRLVMQSFRCFDNLDIKFGCGTDNDDYAGLTVIVAENGQGKSSILDAVKYLLARFLTRFGVKTPSPSAVELLRKSCPELPGGSLRLNATIEGKPETINCDLTGAAFDQRADFMALTGFMQTDRTDDGTSIDSSFVRWDIVRRKNKTEKTQRLVSEHGFGIGSKMLWKYADEIINADKSGAPRIYPVIAYYGTDRRLQRQKTGPVNAISKLNLRKNMYNDALTAGLNYRQLVEWMFKIENRKMREMSERRDFDYKTIEIETVELAIRRMLPNFMNLRVETNPLTLLVDVDEGGVSYTRIVDQQLSDGYRIVLTMVLDIVARILEGNAVLPDMTAEKLLDVPGIVLIDEVDLHLHPSWQQHVIPDLRKTFPNIQFIVTTHSPQVVSSVPKECLRILSHGRLQSFTTQTEGVESQYILAQIFGVDATPTENEWAKKLDVYSKCLSGYSIPDVDIQSLSAELDSHYGCNYQPLMRMRLLSKNYKEN